MPLFDYECQKCGKKFSEVVKITRKSNPKCPKCKSRKTKKIITGAPKIMGASKKS